MESQQDTAPEAQSAGASSGNRNISSRLIVNALPVNDEERKRFVQAAGGIRQKFVNSVADRGNMLWHAEVPEELQTEVTAILGNVKPEQASACPRLEWLQTWSAGVDRYVAPGALGEHTVVTNATGAYGLPVGEHMFALMWALMKQLPDYSRNQAAHRWEDAGDVLSPQGGSVVVIGTGDIGSYFARLAKSVGMHTYGVRRDASRGADGIDEIHSFDDLDDLLALADVVAMVVPSTPQTHHLLDARRLALLKPNAIVINAGRGDAIDPKALLDVLHEGGIRGAGLDVTEPEPLPADDPLWDEPRCLITPHVAGGNHLAQTSTAIISIALENVRRYAAGKPFINRRR
ncbi:D-2-hydroxyacid dehydrogenase [Bifidobacterium sp.]|jgi:phosphoglycerate dehydrogenase-like enzyme|uniref:D-2-hydroxyacid dehydrogenase n=1 Tax=Bifidobacterium sp. TaxID=41200 RepID=UPI0025C40676|nr:D-2-hydroxyacid dehydrogenase [Bifidobacterium sp.]MCH4208638.1 D-2-hydroxyacid dehydrogenase [Bifidobacterium sp.]MCI1224389.1 D-2-hydroxyacid dehydrogenase [Bifidobacterium sp.]